MHYHKMIGALLQHAYSYIYMFGNKMVLTCKILPHSNVKGPHFQHEPFGCSDLFNFYFNNVDRA